MKMIQQREIHDKLLTALSDPKLRLTGIDIQKRRWIKAACVQKDEYRNTDEAHRSKIRLNVDVSSADLDRGLACFDGDTDFVSMSA